MNYELFRSGGPHNVKKTGPHQYSFAITFPPDRYGRVGRQCPNDDCVPGYFKVKGGTGITEEQESVFCPYCRTEKEPVEFTTSEQLRYGKDIVSNEAMKGMNKMLSDALGLGPSGRKKYGGGLISMELSVKSDRPKPVRSPFEEQVQREIVCPHCGLDHAVFGLATWCHDCGKDIFLTHLEAECNVIQLMLDDIPRRHELLGPRIAARDTENCLEDCVSIFETVLKHILKKHMLSNGQTEDEFHEVMRQKIRNRFQDVELADKFTNNLLGISLLQHIDPSESGFLKHTFNKRHPITHNLGIVDRKYLEKALSAEKEGRDISLRSDEIRKAIEICRKILGSLYESLFLSVSEQEPEK